MRTSRAVELGGVQGALCTYCVLPARRDGFLGLHGLERGLGGVVVEHLDVVLSLVDRLSQLNEGDEDIESIIDETIANALYGEEEN